MYFFFFFQCYILDKSLIEDVKKNQSERKSPIERFNKQKFEACLERGRLSCLDVENTTRSETLLSGVFNKMNMDSLEIKSNCKKADSILEMSENLQPSCELNTSLSSYIQSNLDELEISDSDDLLCAISVDKGENFNDCDE